jgi:hypothetical protein
VAGCCERGNEPSGSVKCSEFLDQRLKGTLLYDVICVCRGDIQWSNTDSFHLPRRLVDIMMMMMMMIIKKPDKERNREDSKI